MYQDMELEVGLRRQREELMVDNVEPEQSLDQASGSMSSAQLVGAIRAQMWGDWAVDTHE